jgi:hydrogenase-4 component E
MTNLIDTLMVALLLVDLWLLGTSRLHMLIRLVAFQGILLGALPALAQPATWRPSAVLLIVTSVTLKGIVFPWLLLRILRRVEMRRDLEPLISYVTSLVCGLGALVISFWLSAALPLPSPSPSGLLVPTALTTILVGLLLIVSRRRALTQVAGYLVLENGIYVLAVRLLGEVPLLVELGVLLDAFVAVFVMSIATYRINRTFDHMDVDQLTSLRE